MEVTDVNISDLPRIVRKMKRTRHSACGQCISCTLIWHLALKNEQADVAIFHAGAIPLILDAMRWHVSEVKVQDAACKALVMLGKTSNEAVCVALREAVPLVLQAMRVHEEAAVLQLLCCQAIWSIAQWPANCVSFGQAGAIPLLARCVDRHTGDEELQLRIQEWGCNALARLSEEDANVSALASPGTVAVVLKAMGRHASVGEIQSAGCQLFMHLTLCKEKEEKEEARAAATHGTKFAHLPFEPGALDVILEAMQLHPTESEVQMVGCLAMASDAFHENAPIDLATACALVLRAMEAPANEHVRACGCCALHRFAEEPENRAAMGQFGVIPAIVGYMDRTTENKEQETVSRMLLKWGCAALYKLFQADCNKGVLARTDAVAVILKAMGLDASHEGIRSDGCQILANLQLSTADLITASSVVQKALLSSDMDVQFQRLGRKALRRFERAQSGPPDVRCANCGRDAADLGFRLQQCAGCRRVTYCGKDCRKEHWKACHKAQCAGAGTS